MPLNLSLEIGAVLLNPSYHSYTTVNIVNLSLMPLKCITWKSLRLGCCVLDEVVVLVCPVNYSYHFPATVIMYCQAKSNDTSSITWDSMRFSCSLAS